MIPTASLIRELFNELLYVQDSDFSTDKNPGTVTCIRTGTQTNQQ
jgi:hypothetical protein